MRLEWATAAIAMGMLILSGCAAAQEVSAEQGAVQERTKRAVAAGTVVEGEAEQGEAEQDAGLYEMTAEQFAAYRPAGKAVTENFDPALAAAGIFHATNAARAEHDLPPLAHLPELDQAAAMQSRAMKAGDFVGHIQADNPDLREPIDRVRASGLTPRFVAENVANEFSIQYESGRRVYPLHQWGREGFSYEPDGKAIPPHSYLSFGREVVRGWMNSPGHRRNILSKNPTFLGTACEPATAEDGLDKWFCTQVFFAPMTPRR